VLSGGEVGTVRTGVLLLAISLFYVAGMYLNDAFDREIDARERPERPIPSGLISSTTVFATGFAMLAAGLALVILAGGMEGGIGGWRASLAAGVLAGAIVLYDWHHKGNPLSPVLMGMCRVLVYLVAGYASAPIPGVALYVGAGLLLCYLVGLTYVAKFETRARLHRPWPLVFLAAPFVYGAHIFSAWIAAPYALFLTWTVYALSFLLVPGRVNVPRAVGYMIAGIALLDAMLIAAQGQPGLAALAVLGFAMTLLLQRYIAGT
jgi:4-hydroxybenzoate polyprenyltransferase